MENIRTELTALIGNTPMLKLSKITDSPDIKAEVIVKLEYFNPGGSVKDRIALAMIEDAERSGEIRHLDQRRIWKVSPVQRMSAQGTVDLTGI